MKKNLLLILVVITFNISAQTTMPSFRDAKIISKKIVIEPSTPVTINYTISGSLTKKIILNITNSGEYAGLSVFVNGELLMDDFNIPTKGKQKITSLITFKKLGKVKIKFQSLDETLTINNIYFEDLPKLNLPVFKDITVKAGMDKVSSIKYGGPSIADIDNDGDYDFIVNNHNAETSKLYWNNGDGTVTKHYQDLSRWFKHDLHGTSLGDFDNDGDLDLVLEQGGGNGTNPSTLNFYLNDNNKLILYTGDVGIDKGARGRSSRWVDMDLDGDLDLIIVNESSLKFDKPQHFFYENNGNATFKYRSVKGIEDVEESRVLVTDFNNDMIDDLIFYGSLSFWKGNGDFTYTNVTNLVPENIQSLTQIMAVTDIDIDNDGDLDLYLARGLLFEHGEGEAPSLDFNPITKELALKTRGYKGEDAFDFTSEGFIKLHKYYYLEQGSLLGKDYPIFMGENKTRKIVKSGEELVIYPKIAEGWPKDISENGFYIGYLGNSKWRVILVRDDNFFWQYRFSLSNISSVTPKFTPHNRNHSDILLRNDGNKFIDVSKEWKLPRGGNSLGVTTGDFNNDSYQDLFVYRWGRVGARVSDYMLLNTGKNSFETTTMHGANDVGGPGNGDMGQAFDFDLDGKLDLLNGSEGGEWYLYSNETVTQGNFVLVRVGYAPKSNVDPISAEVIVNTANNEYRKRVGSSGEVFSQSLMNIIHFGLGNENKIERIKIIWRNGETIEFKNKDANVIYDTDKIDPKSISIEPLTIRKGSKIALNLSVTPKNANSSASWLTSDESIISVDERGIAEAHGAINRTATITATSKANGLIAKRDIEIVKWTPKPVTSIIINAEKTKLYTGQSAKLTAIILPENADNSELTWESNNSNVLTVDNKGIVKAKTPGTAIIRAATADNSVFSEIKIKIEPFVAPYIKIVNKAEIKKQPLKIGNNLKVSVIYNAGSENRIISADEGGIRFWLRHFKSKWIPVKDVVLTDKEVLYTESGTATKTFSLRGLVPSKKLPKGHFYQLRVTFTASNGEMYSDDILPLEIEVN
ncbi:FG-GAP-like repeat-containing protein [Lutibacter sp. A80]|uniref:FG-GAP-like repeat-containing protein n=1 Tax=Lutibacter sp. A80 TaxID=2918453 RepID=UPI001F062E09|nr:FG-GAP-like repeat-containing protein [Lutibacter sp. A80]UMB61744.1 FG-GAP-like repeat-containing protein [Lutibacter sp. A80]